MSNEQYGIWDKYLVKSRRAAGYDDSPAAGRRRGRRASKPTLRRRPKPPPPPARTSFEPKPVTPSREKTIRRAYLSGATYAETQKMLRDRTGAGIDNNELARWRKQIKAERKAAGFADTTKKRAQKPTIPVKDRPSPPPAPRRIASPTPSRAPPPPSQPDGGAPFLAARSHGTKLKVEYRAPSGKIIARYHDLPPGGKITPQFLVAAVAADQKAMAKTRTLSAVQDLWADSLTPPAPDDFEPVTYSYY